MRRKILIPLSDDVSSGCEHNWEKTDSYYTDWWVGYADDAVLVEGVVIEYTCTKCGAEKEESFDGSESDEDEYYAETSSDLDCSYCGISGSDREGEPLCSRCLGCFECCETLHDEGQHQDFEAERYVWPSLTGFEKIYGFNIKTYEKLEKTTGWLLNQINKETLNMGEEYWYSDERYRDLELRETIKQDMGLAAESETPIMPPMGFGESVNWTPHDGTPSLRRDRRRSEGDEGDYSIWDYGEPACHICQEHTDEPNAADKYCGNCDMSLCEWCYNDESHTCLTGEVTNITNVGNEVYVTIRLPDGREQILLGSMEDVMLNDYVNSRGQTIRFNTETDNWR